MAACTAPVPTSIKFSLQNLVLKRLQHSNNTVDINSIWDQKQKKYELSEEELAKVTARKIQNKKAARKSREKFRNRIQRLEQEHAGLIEENKRLVAEITKLKREIQIVRQTSKS